MARLESFRGSRVGQSRQTDVFDFLSVRSVRTVGITTQVHNLHPLRRYGAHQIRALIVVIQRKLVLAKIIARLKGLYRRTDAAVDVVLPKIGAHRVDVLLVLHLGVERGDVVQVALFLFNH